MIEKLLDEPYWMDLDKRLSFLLPSNGKDFTEPKIRDLVQLLLKKESKESFNKEALKEFITSHLKEIKEETLTYHLEKCYPSRYLKEITLFDNLEDLFRVIEIHREVKEMVSLVKDNDLVLLKTDFFSFDTNEKYTRVILQNPQFSKEAKLRLRLEIVNHTLKRQKVEIQDGRFYLRTY